jgi:hypothetical protein
MQSYGPIWSKKTLFRTISLPLMEPLHAWTIHMKNSLLTDLVLRYTEESLAHLY